MERGLKGQGWDKTEPFLLGYVEDALPGHSPYEGMLAIPYLRPTTQGGVFVASLRFRCLEDHEHQGHGKYMTVPGDRARMYNTLALIDACDTIAITEGELDAITAVACGVPAVGLPGAQSWKPWFRDPFLGYETVYVLADGDEAGHRFAVTVMKDLPNAKHIPMPKGEDVNSVVRAGGPKALTDRIQ